jgi:type I restriction enzyme S subunit
MSAREPVRPGYKRTEVGVIPEDWDVSRIDQIGDVKGGKRLPLGRSLTERRTLHPYIRVSDMKNGTIATDAVLFVPDAVFPSIRNYRISRDDIYISVAGTLGLIGRVPPELDGANLTENADKITNLTCKPDFLYF